MVFYFINSYGDVNPLTDIGKFLGSLLMISGIDFPSLITALSSSSFIDNYNKERKQQLHEKIFKHKANIENEIKQLKDSIDNFKK